MKYRCIKCSGVVEQQKAKERKKCDHCGGYKDSIWGIEIVFECHECHEIYQTGTVMFSSADPRPSFTLERI